MLCCDFPDSPSKKKRRIEKESDSREDMDVDDEDELKFNAPDLQNPVSSENEDGADDNGFDPDKLRRQADEDGWPEMSTSPPPWNDLQDVVEFIPFRDRGAFLHDYENDLPETLDDAKERMVSFLPTDQFFIFSNVRSKVRERPVSSF